MIFHLYSILELLQNLCLISILLENFGSVFHVKLQHIVLFIIKCSLSLVNM